MACNYIIKPYRPPVQQGNIINDEAVTHLKPGMTKAQVSNLLGEPVLIDPFDKNTWNYIYTYQPSRGRLQQKKLIIYFTNNRVSSYTVDLPPPQRPRH